MSRKYRKNKGKQEVVQVSVWMPKVLHRALKHLSVEEDCSISWIMTDAILKRLGLAQKDLDEERGYSLDKTFDERKSNPKWSPFTKASLGLEEEKEFTTVKCADCGVVRTIRIEDEENDSVPACECYQEEG